MDIVSRITFSHTLLSSAFSQSPYTAIALFLPGSPAKSRIIRHFPFLVIIILYITPLPGTCFYVGGVINNPPSRATIQVKVVLESYYESNVSSLPVHENP